MIGLALIAYSLVGLGFAVEDISNDYAPKVTALLTGAVWPVLVVFAGGYALSKYLKRRIP